MKCFQSHVTHHCKSFPCGPSHTIVTSYFYFLANYWITLQETWSEFIYSSLSLRLLGFLQDKHKTNLELVMWEREIHDVSIINFQRPVSIFPTSSLPKSKSLNFHFKTALFCVQKCLPEGAQPDTHGIHDQVRSSSELQDREDWIVMSVGNCARIVSRTWWWRLWLPRRAVNIENWCSLDAYDELNSPLLPRASPDYWFSESTLISIRYYYVNTKFFNLNKNRFKLQQYICKLIHSYNKL
jgi:hypothetical protein